MGTTRSLILGRCEALRNIKIHNEDFHIFHTIGKIKAGNESQGYMHCFCSIYTALI